MNDRDRRSAVIGVLAAVLLAAGAQSAAAGITQGPSTRDPYELVTIGDSAGAGEGAPDVDGLYNDIGDLLGQFEDWDTRFDGSPAVPGLNQDSSRCHRSGHTSSSAVARGLLQAEFPDVVFNWVSVACSGASILNTAQVNGDAPPAGSSGGILTPYAGVESLKRRGINASQLKPALYPSQIAQVNTILNGRSGTRKRIDALLMSLGVNDIGFAEVVAQCLNITTVLDCNTNEGLQTFVDDRLGRLNSRFNRLSDAVNGINDPDVADPLLANRPAAVFLMAYFNPLRPTTTTHCDQQPPGGYEKDLKSAESRWAETRVLGRLNDRLADEADEHEWTLVRSHVNRFWGHAICSPAPDNWVNTNLQSLRVQGELDSTEGLPLPVAVGGGIAHPNREGYRQIGIALAADMRLTVVQRYSAVSAPQTQALARATGFTIVADDPDSIPNRPISGYWHRYKLRALVNVNGQTAAVDGPDGLRDVGYGQSSSAYIRTGRYLATTRTCGPVSRDGLLGCGPTSSERRISTFIPALPRRLSATAGRPASPFGNLVPSDPTISVVWHHADLFAMHDTRRTVVRIQRSSGLGFALVKQQTLEGTGTGIAISSGLEEGVDYFVSVKACNDEVGCSSFTPQVRTRALRVEAEGASELALQIEQVRLDLEGPPCAGGSIPFDASLPNSGDPFANFQPNCFSDPPVGKLSLARKKVTTRPGRPAAVELHWTHPRRWHDIQEVTVRISDRRGVRATLRFDDATGTLALDKGTRRGGKRLKLGRAGTLRAGGLTVRIGETAVVGSGPAGRDVQLKFGLVASRGPLGLSIGASDDSGTVQAPKPAGVIIVRR